MISIRTRG